MLQKGHRRKYEKFLLHDPNSKGSHSPLPYSISLQDNGLMFITALFFYMYYNYQLNVQENLRKILLKALSFIHFVF